MSRTFDFGGEALACEWRQIAAEKKAWVAPLPAGGAASTRGGRERLPVGADHGASGPAVTCSAQRAGPRRWRSEHICPPEGPALMRPEARRLARAAGAGASCGLAAKSVARFCGRWGFYLPEVSMHRSIPR